MKLYCTATSPYARLARIVVIEKGLAQRVEIIIAETRKAGSPFYAINPSGRVPYLVRDDGSSMEDSQLIALYLDHLDGKPQLHPPFAFQDWDYGRLETYARSLTDGVSVFAREMRRPENERSPTLIEHEIARSGRLADQWERDISHPLMQGPLNMAQLLLVAGLDMGTFHKIGNLEQGRPQLAAWARKLRERPSVASTAPDAS